MNTTHDLSSVGGFIYEASSQHWLDDDGKMGNFFCCQSEVASPEIQQVKVNTQCMMLPSKFNPKILRF